MIDFAAIESLVNTSVQSAFSNATLSYLSGATLRTIDGVFLDKRDQPDPIGTPRGVRLITFQILEAALGTLAAGTTVTVRAVNYSLSRIERDKTGWVTLHLRGGVA